jgi:hypothetical protein
MIRSIIYLITVFTVENCLSAMTDEAKIRKSRGSFSKQKGIIIVIFAGHF